MSYMENILFLRNIWKIYLHVNIVAESDFGLGTRKQDLVKLFKTKIIPKNSINIKIFNLLNKILD